MKSSRVFFVQEDRSFNVKPAQKYGEFIFVYSPDERVYPFDTDAIIARCLETLEANEYDPEQDYIAFTGSHILVALMFGVVMKEWDDPRVLLFDAKSQQYNERTITLGD